MKSFQAVDGPELSHKRSFDWRYGDMNAIFDRAMRLRAKVEDEASASLTG
jgi:hypothetical protein